MAIVADIVAATAATTAVTAASNAATATAASVAASTTNAVVGESRFKRLKSMAKKLFYDTLVTLILGALLLPVNTFIMCFIFVTIY